jgi:hypothetical protein
MADGRNSATPQSSSSPLWREIFRGFQIALDPRKLLLAAAGIVSMSVIWWLLSVIFFNLSPRPLRESETYSNARIQQELGSQTKPGTNEPYREEDLKRIGDERFQADLERWLILEELAGCAPCPGTNSVGKTRLPSCLACCPRLPLLGVDN